MEINICKNAGNIWCCHPILWIIQINIPSTILDIPPESCWTSDKYQRISLHIYIDVIPDSCPYLHAYYDTPFIVLHMRFVYSILYIHPIFILFYEPVAIQPVWSVPNLFDTVNTLNITHFHEQDEHHFEL
jgi:hypothetical protein